MWGSVLGLQGVLQQGEEIVDLAALDDEEATGR
jgi:hypothetical protein